MEMVGEILHYPRLRFQADLQGGIVASQRGSEVDSHERRWRNSGCEISP
jgi:hypothetical protein